MPAARLPYVIGPLQLSDPHMYRVEDNGNKWSRRKRASANKDALQTTPCGGGIVIQDAGLHKAFKALVTSTEWVKKMNTVIKYLNQRYKVHIMQFLCLCKEACSWLTMCSRTPGTCAQVAVLDCQGKHRPTA